MEYVLGVDFGTSYFKMGLFNHQGDLCGLGRVAVVPDQGDGSRSEIPLSRFWSLLRSGLAEACRQAQAKPGQIRAVAYASQANSFVLLDRYRHPLTPIILWNDQRGRDLPQTEKIFEKKDFLHCTGLGIACNPEFCVAKITWMQKHQPELLLKAAHLLTLSDYFVFSLTGAPVGDAGTASLLGLLNLHTLTWLGDVIDLADLHLSTPLIAGTIAGGVSRQGVALLGLNENVPVVLGSLDHHLAALGAGLGSIAEMSESTGTVLACLKDTAEFLPRPGICTGLALNKGAYYQLCFSGNGAASLEWYCQTYAPESSMADLEQGAAAVEIGSAGLLARPDARRYPDLSGFLNRKAVHSPVVYVRAIMESTAADLTQLVNALATDNLPKKITATGGGAQSDLWLQIKADLLGIEFIRTATKAPACMGAAMLAARAIGWFPDLATLSQTWIKIKKWFHPIPANQEKYQAWYMTRAV